MRLSLIICVTLVTVVDCRKWYKIFGRLRSSAEITTESDSMSEITTRVYNDTYKLYGPTQESEPPNMSSVEPTFYMINKKDKRYKSLSANSFKLLPGDTAKTPLMRIGKFIGAIPILKRGFGVRCWPFIGCFAAFNARNGSMGSFGMLPMSPKEIRVKFTLFTAKSQQKPIELVHNFDIDLMKRSTFNPSHQTVIVVHGFKSGLAQWMIDIKDMLFKMNYSDYNVVLVDWEKGSNIHNYMLAASNTQVVGAMIAFFIDRICDTTYDHKIKNDMFYLIGHSLGAHIMGFAAKRLYQPKVARITGLDPAGPLFELYPTQTRLSYKDATQVDIIHSDGARRIITGLGIFDPIGDMDFYPNGGNLQPGCPKTIMLNNIMKYSSDVSCSHSRSYELSNAFGKVDSNCLPIGYICEDWNRFLEGQCVNCDFIDDISQCQIMGLYPSYWKNVVIENKPGAGQKYFLNTAKHNDFCLYHYQIAFHVSTKSNWNSNGEIDLVLQALVDGKKKYLTINRIITGIRPGKIHSLLVTFKFLVKIKSLSVKWIRFKKKSNCGKIIKLDYVEINYLSHISERIRRKLSVMLCPASKTRNKLYPDGEEINFDECRNRTKPAITALHYQVNLVPLTDHKDIFNVDYENEDFIR